MYVDVFRDDRRSMNKIVYVEDEPEVGQLIAAYLGKHDIEVNLVAIALKTSSPAKIRTWCCWTLCCPEKMA